MEIQPETQFTQNGDISIAYQVLGDGPFDLVVVPGFVSHLEQTWEEPSFTRFLKRLASFCRLILFDKRGTGLSERIAGIPTLEERMDDVRAVMDAAGSERAAVFGISEGGSMAVLFAATYPERTSALVLYGSIARLAWAPDYPWGQRSEDKARMEAWFDGWRNQWGGPYSIEIWAPSATHDEAFRAWWAKYLRLSASPSAVINIFRMNSEIDVRGILPAIHLPTLVLHRTGDPALSIEHGRYLAQHIPDAKFVELKGDDHLMWVGDSESLIDEIEEFLTGVRSGPDPDRVLATVLFTDIVGATERAVKLGDGAWRDLLERHHAMVRDRLARFRGHEVDTAGDSFFATFDGPARAIQCACAIRDAVASLGIDIRAGLHTGECEVMGEKISGIAVHIGARVMQQTTPGEILVSSTVKDLVVGSGLQFVDREVHELKGVPGEWHLFAVEQ